MKRLVEHKLQECREDPVKLARLRWQVRPIGSGPLGMMRMLTEFIEAWAELKGWDLDKYNVKDEQSI